MIDLKEYWARIGFAPREDEEAEEQLIRLHRCHSLTVPFEDLNSFCRQPVVLDLDEVYEKVVRRHRGGYCFELNRLFQELLTCMGYNARSILCRPYSGEGLKLPLTHRLITVPIDGKLWLCDVGLGGNGWVEPLLFELDIEQVQMGRTYRIIEDPEMGYVVQCKRNGGFAQAVAFNLQYAEESDFEMSNHYTSTFPGSPFVNRLMCTLPTEDGRYTIRDTSFTVECNGKLDVEPLRADTFQDVLKVYFGIELQPEMNEHIRGYLLRSAAM